MAYLTEMPDRPLLAIVGGGCLEPRLQLVDGLLDLVDTLAIGGAMSVTLLAALRAEENVFTGGGGGGGGGRKRIKKWGKDCAGLPRDPVDVFVAARRLIVKARKRGVKVSKSRLAVREKYNQSSRGCRFCVFLARR